MIDNENRETKKKIFSDLFLSFIQKLFIINKRKKQGPGLLCKEIEKKNSKRKEKKNKNAVITGHIK
jgi:hypothetical protein